MTRPVQDPLPGMPLVHGPATARIVHEQDDGCMWCCEKCNTDRHYCPGCGAVTDHRKSVCEECDRL